jgi:hypothetical protein
MIVDLTEVIDKITNETELRDAIRAQSLQLQIIGKILPKKYIQQIQIKCPI